MSDLEKIHLSDLDGINPALTRYGRQEPAPVLPLREEPDLLSWLETSGRLVSDQDSDDHDDPFKNGFFHINATNAASTDTITLTNGTTCVLSGSNNEKIEVDGSHIASIEKNSDDVYFDENAKQKRT